MSFIDTQTWPQLPTLLLSMSYLVYLGLSFLAYKIGLLNFPTWKGFCEDHMRQHLSVNRCHDVHKGMHCEQL